MSRGREKAALRVSAEFVLIVVGVLVAFAVDDWAARRSARMEEARYLERLLSDVRRDSALYEDLFLPSLVRAESILVETRPIARGDAPFPADTIDFLENLAYTHVTPVLSISGTTYDELLATGTLSLLQSQDLRSEVVAYYSSVRVASARGESREAGYPALVRAYLPEYPGVFSDPGSTEELLRSYGVREAAAMVRTSEFMREMHRHLAYLAVMRGSIADLHSQAMLLIPRLDEALQGSR